jgi:hypothetical protein
MPCAMPSILEPGKFFTGTGTIFLDKASLQAWLETRHNNKPPRGRAFVSTWRYAILLWNVLNALHSVHASEVLTKLLKLNRTWRESLNARVKPDLK